MTRCFVCNRIKEEEQDGWWALYLWHAVPSMQFGLCVRPYASLERGLDPNSYKPTCGNNCSQKLVERYLTTGSLDAPRATGGAA